MNAYRAALLDDVGSLLLDAFMAPVIWLTSVLGGFFSDLARSLNNVEAAEAPLWAVIVAAVVWILIIFVAWRLLKFVRNTIRNVGAWIRTIHFRISLAAGIFKTRIVCRLRQLLPQRNSSGISVIPDIEFDELDMAVMRSMSARGPGYALSAPDIAEQLRMRPAQVQRRLEWLTKNRMLEDVIGSTDGYDNYRLSNSGISFLAMWQRQHQAT
jgi:hypothetical protein